MFEDLGDFGDLGTNDFIPLPGQADSPGGGADGEMDLDDLFGEEADELSEGSTLIVEDDDPAEPPFPKDNCDCVRHTTLDKIVITWNLFMLTLDSPEVIRSQLRQTLFRFPLYGTANT